MKEVNSNGKSVALYEIPQIENYKRIHQPMMSQNNKKTIKQKLDLQKQSIRNTRQRQKVGDYFITFNRNPFTDFQIRNPFLNPEKKHRQQLQRNLVHEILKNRQNRIVKPSFLQKFAQIDNNLQNTQMLSQKIVYTTKNNRKQSTKIQTQIGNTTKQQDQANQLALTDIDSILKIKDENFFLKKAKPLNIFHYGMGQSYQSGNKQLEKHYFSFTSVIEKIQKIKIPIYRDLSRLGRRVVLGLSTGKDNIIDYVDSYQLSFKTNELLFHDLMSVASGRFSAQFVNKAINFDGDYAMNKQASDTSSTQSNINVFYRQGQINQECRFTNGNQQAQQIIDYLRLDLNKKEKKYDQRCVGHKEAISGHIKTMQNLVLLTIKDNKLHKNLAQKVKQQMQVFIDMDKKDVDTDRTIRQNKRNKQKQQSIKLQRLLQTIQKVNQHEKKMGNNTEQIMFNNNKISNKKMKDIIN